eukprot:116196-Hanusia_phi.AAC.1
MRRIDIKDCKQGKHSQRNTAARADRRVHSALFRGVAYLSSAVCCSKGHLSFCSLHPTLPYINESKCHPLLQI